MFDRDKKIELLAPAKDKECAIAAINAGADAVYMGYSKFGARKNAGNSISDIEEAVLYAHKFGARIYVTINTILTDEELEESEEAIKQLKEIGVDAIIVQDMGLLTPEKLDIPIFASTQCNNVTVNKVQFLESKGASRVILARELSLAEIQNICENTNVEIETFIHGALCVSYSGQCYLSYAIGKRSANRGECAQPCRKKYSLVDSLGKVIKENSHLLCLKDFNLSNHLEELVLAGVTSFKIEGRLKNVSYIKNVVGFYRKKLDEILHKLKMQKSSEGVVTLSFEPDLNKSFNRGFTNYFLKGRNKNITSFETPKSRGELIGKVVVSKKGRLKVDKGEFQNGDGLCFFKDNEFLGFNVNKVEDGFICHSFAGDIPVGTVIYRNFDKKFEDILSADCTSRKIPVDIEIGEENNNLIFKMSDGKNIAIIQKPNEFEEALNKEKMAESFEKQFSKLNETEFCLYKFKINLQKYPFIRVSELNSIRRELAEEMSKVKQKAFEKLVVVEKKHPKDVQLGEKEVTFTANILNKKAQNFYENEGIKVFEKAFESGLNPEGKKVMTTKHCLKHSLGLCPKQAKVIKFKEPFFLVDEFGKKYKLKFDCANCRMEIYF